VRRRGQGIISAASANEIRIDQDVLGVQGESIPLQPINWIVDGNRIVCGNGAICRGRETAATLAPVFVAATCRNGIVRLESSRIRQ